MKKLFFFFLFCFICELACQGQHLFSLENLQQVKSEDLSIYLTFAQNQKKTGTTVLKAGVASFAAGLLVVYASYDRDEWIGINTGTAIGSWMMVLGVEAAVVSIPIQITASNRIKRIKELQSQSSSRLIFEVVPSSFHCSTMSSNHYGGTLRILF